MGISFKDYCDLLARHPHLKPHEIANSQRRLPARVIEPDSGQALVSDPPKKKRSSGGRRPGSPILRILFISTSRRNRFQDDDNHAAALKQIRDAICDWLKIDDGDPRVDFEYSQVRSRGAESVIVRLELQ